MSKMPTHPSYLETILFRRPSRPTPVVCTARPPTARDPLRAGARNASPSSGRGSRSMWERGVVWAAPPPPGKPVGQSRPVGRDHNAAGGPKVVPTVTGLGRPPSGPHAGACERKAPPARCAGYGTHSPRRPIALNIFLSNPWASPGTNRLMPVSPGLRVRLGSRAGTGSRNVSSIAWAWMVLPPNATTVCGHADHPAAGGGGSGATATDQTGTVRPAPLRCWVSSVPDGPLCDPAGPRGRPGPCKH